MFYDEKWKMMEKTERKTQFPENDVIYDEILMKINVWVGVCAQ